MVRKEKRGRDKLEEDFFVIPYSKKGRKGEEKKGAIFAAGGEGQVRWTGKKLIWRRGKKKRGSSVSVGRGERKLEWKRGRGGGGKEGGKERQQQRRGNDDAAEKKRVFFPLGGEMRRGYPAERKKVVYEREVLRGKKVSQRERELVRGSILQTSVKRGERRKVIPVKKFEKERKICIEEGVSIPK